MLLEGILLSIDGLALLFGAAPIFAIDAIRHSLTVGFIMFGLSGPVGLTLALCLTINLWPAIWPSK